MPHVLHCRTLLAVAEVHRIVSTRAATDFRVAVVERDGQSLFRIDPIHRHERFQIGHAEAKGVIGADAGGFKDLTREEILDLFTLDAEV